MKPATGSFLWLVAHDLRLNWRRFAGMLGVAGGASPWAIVAVAAIASHALAWPVAQWLAPVWTRSSGLDAAAQGPLIALVICVFSWMIAQSLFGTMRTLYDRGDLDLLMGSPLSARKVLAAKALAIAGSTLGSIAVLVLPLANVGALIDGAHWLAIYPVLVSMALIATALALFTGIGLFFLCGARRARLIVQLTGALIGGGFVLAAQIVILLPDHLQAAVMAWLVDGGSTGTVLRRVLALPVAAALGDGGSIAMLVAAAVVRFGIAVWLLSERFASASLAATGVSVSSKRNVPGIDRPLRFRTGPAASLRRKEWRLLLRDPGLFAQISLQIVYTIPLVIVLLKSGALPAAVAIAPSLVVIAAQVAASLAWLTVSGEDAPELIASAPVAPSAVDRAKLVAIAAPVAAMMVVPLVALAMISLKAAVLAMALAAGACVSTALLNLWHPMPGNRRGMLRRHSQSKLLALVEHIIAVLWAVAAVLLLIGTLWGLLPIVLAGLVLLLSGPAGSALALCVPRGMVARLRMARISAPVAVAPSK